MNEKAKKGWWLPKYPLPDRSPRSLKKYKPERLYALVLEELAKYGESKWGNSHTDAEYLAKRLRVRPHLITQIFHKLNLKGGMSRAINHWHMDNEWGSTRYEVYSKKMQKIWKEYQNEK